MVGSFVGDEAAEVQARWFFDYCSKESLTIDIEEPPAPVAATAVTS